MAEPEEDFKTKIETQKTLRAGLHQRMDDDRDLLFLKKYELKDKDGQPIQGIINITLNDPAVFEANVKSQLGSANEQTVVESEDKSVDTKYIEDFQKAARGGADKLLQKRKKPPLNYHTDDQLCNRGRAGVRCCFRMEGDVLIPDLLPFDTRFAYYEAGVAGFDWFANETTRSKASILKEYKHDIPGDTAMVWDCWDSKVNEIWIDEVKFKTEPNKYGYPPFVLEIVPLGSLLADPEAFAHYGESIFFLIRDIIPELNRLVSILQTINMASIAGPKQFASKGGVTAKVPKGSSRMGSMTAIDIGGGITLVPIADIKRAATLLHSMIETRLQRGSLSSIDLGTLTFPMSAIALITIGEGKDQVFLPRLNTKALLNQSLADMLTQQVIAIGGSVELGTPGHKRKFDTSKLGGEYETRYKYFPKSPQVDVARLSAATAAERYYDKMTILKDILHAEDPEGIMRKRYFDLAEAVSPLVLRRRIVKSLIEQEEPEEAELVSIDAGVNLEQILAGKAPEVAEQKPVEKPMAGMLPLFDKGEGKSSAKRSAELQQTPVEGEED